MHPLAVNTTFKVAAPSLGAFTAVMIEDYHGHPAWLVFVAMTVALLFGLMSSVARAKDRRLAMAESLINLGSLWTLAFAAVWMEHLDVPSAMLTALVTGVVGSPIIEQLYRRWGP